MLSKEKFSFRLPEEKVSFHFPPRPPYAPSPSDPPDPPPAEPVLGQAGDAGPVRSALVDAGMASEIAFPTAHSSNSSLPESHPAGALWSAPVDAAPRALPVASALPGAPNSPREAAVDV